MTPPLDPAAPAPLLRVHALRQSFGGVVALDDVSFDIFPGEMVALIGPNGAGKSTCFNILGGQSRPVGGTVHFQGRLLNGLSPQAIWRLGVGRTFQTAATFATLSARENVQTALLSRDRRLGRFWRRAASYAVAQADELLAQVGLAEQAERAAGVLTYGDVKRLELALALAHAPTLLLMDEPAAGMNTAERHALMALVSRLVRERGLAVLFTEHSLDVVHQHANRVVVLAQGRLIACATPAEIAEDPQVRLAYLGSDMLRLPEVVPPQH